MDHHGDRRRDPVFAGAVLCAAAIGLACALSASGPASASDSAVNYFVKAGVGIFVFFALYVAVLFTYLAWRGQWPRRIHSNRLGGVELPDATKSRAESLDESLENLEKRLLPELAARHDAQIKELEDEI